MLGTPALGGCAAASTEMDSVGNEIPSLDSNGVDGPALDPATEEAESEQADDADEVQGDFAPDAEDEATDEEDSLPDPVEPSEEVDPIGAPCPSKDRALSPKGMTFALHVSKHYEEATLAQLVSVKHLIRARDVFVIEKTSPTVKKLKKEFPCNRVHFIAYPDEWGKAVAAKGEIDGIAIDWEGYKVWNGGQAWSQSRLSDFASKIRAHGLTPSVVPYWPSSFDDGHIVKKSKMRFQLAQIQNRCAHEGPSGFASAAKALIANYKANGLTARDIGFEISLNSFADKADNHTGVPRSARCTRKAWGKGARSIYIYGNGKPHYAGYFKALAAMGVRTSNK